jgi:hypothetical protein
MNDQASSLEVLTPSALRKIIKDKESAKAAETRASEGKDAEKHRKEHDAFMARHLEPQAMERLMQAVRRAAEQGETHLLVLQFPSEFCTDSGRAIGNVRAEWPATLQGYAAEAFAFFEKELQPLGFKLRAEILSYPGGMPGDVGVYLVW